MNRGAFTLLELIIVIIIVGILSSIALPRFGKFIQQSYATEAVNNLGFIRRAIHRCAQIRNHDQIHECQNFSTLAIDDPGSAPNSHFSYSGTVIGHQNFPGGFQMYWSAIRNYRDGGDGSSTISLVCSDWNTALINVGCKYNGTGLFSAIEKDWD